MINYKKIFERLKKDHIELSSIVSKSVVKTIRNNGVIRLGTLEKICKALKCKPGDVVGV